MSDRMAYCDKCGLGYELGRADIPKTASPYTCDDCGGYVGPEVEKPEVRFSEPTKADDAR